MRNWPWIVGGPLDGSLVAGNDWRHALLMAPDPAASEDRPMSDRLFVYEAVKYEIVRGVAVRFMLPRDQAPEEKMRAALGAIVAAAFKTVDASDVVG